MTDKELSELELLAESERVRVALEDMADRLDTWAKDLRAELARRGDERTSNG